MELGAFSVSLAVKDIQASKAFYEKLGFEEILGKTFAYDRSEMKNFKLSARRRRASTPPEIKAFRTPPPNP